MDAHLGYAKHDPAGRDGGNSRNGHRAKTVLTDVGPVEIDVPRDRDGSFAPKIVAQAAAAAGRGRRHGDLAGRQGPDHRRGRRPTSPRSTAPRCRRDTISRDHRPGAGRPGRVAVPAARPGLPGACSSTRSTSRSATARSPTGPSTSSIGVTVDGERDILGLWAGDRRGEGAKYWLRVLTEIKNRGVARRAASSSATASRACRTRSRTVWPQAIVQTCVVHLIRNTFRYASRRDWDAIARALRPVYTAAVRAAAAGPRSPSSPSMGQQLPGDRPAVGATPGPSSCRSCASTSEIRTRDLHHQRDRVAQRPVPPRGQGPRPLPHRAGRAQVPLPGHPISLDPTGRGRQRWTNRWKPALNAFDITFDGRLSAGRK